MIEELVEALNTIGHSFVALYRSEDGLYMLYAFDEKLALEHGFRKPIFENCRDGMDYKNLKAQWKDAGTYLLYADTNSDRALRNSLDKLIVAI